MNPAAPIIIAATLMGQPLTVTIETKNDTDIKLTTTIKVVEVERE